VAGIARFVASLFVGAMNHPTGVAEQVGADFALFEAAQKDPVRASMQQLGKARLAHRQGQGSQVVAVHHEDVEGVKLDFVIVLAGMQRVEIGNAINAEHDGFAINDELLVSVFQCRFHDPRISLRPIVSTSRGQAHVISAAFDAQTVAVIFYLVKPLRPIRYFDAASGKAEIKSLKHAPQLSGLGANCESVMVANYLQNNDYFLKQALQGDIWLWFCRVLFLHADHGCDGHPAFPAPSLFERDIAAAKLGRSSLRECECLPPLLFDN